MVVSSKRPEKTKRYYAGIGSRRTPPEVLSKLRLLASLLEKMGYTLRSGGAEGADEAFSMGVNHGCNKQIFRPSDATTASMEIASMTHPAWWACDEHARRLHGRNVQIILGHKLDAPVDFVIAWTDNPERGGTSLGLRLAKKNDIPVFNLHSDEDFQKFRHFFASLL